MKKSGISFIILVVVGFGIYFNSFQNPFHFDDVHYIVRNPYIRTIDNIPLYFTNPQTLSSRSTFHAHYRPLVVVSYAFNYHLWKLDPRGYHIVNLVLHLGSSILVFLIVQALLIPPFSKGGIRGIITPLTAGLLFLTTPFNSEVVNYITARSSVMSSFFYLLAFYFWVRYRNKYQIYYIASLFAFILAMLTKEIAITFPLVIWLYDLYFVHRGRTFYWREYLNYIPFLTAGIFLGVILRIVFFGDFVSLWR